MRDGRREMRDERGDNRAWQSVAEQEERAGQRLFIVVLFGLAFLWLAKQEW